MTLRISIMALGLVTLFAFPALAADEWGLPDEKVVRFEAKVVDILCELTGDCPKNCGAGNRQLGLVDDKGKLHLAIKNATPFSGAVAELVDFCEQKVIADGLLTTNRGYTVFALQFVRLAPDGKWRAANRFVPKWAKQFNFKSDGPEAGEWFRNDPRVTSLIKKDGILGLGLDADKKYLAE